MILEQLYSSSHNLYDGRLLNLQCFTDKSWVFIFHFHSKLGSTWPLPVGPVGFIDGSEKPKKKFLRPILVKNSNGTAHNLFLTKVPSSASCVTKILY